MLTRMAQLWVLILGLGLAAVTASANEAPASMKIVNAADGSSVTVISNDLDLASASGARILLRRIESAADRVCGSYRPGDLWARAEHLKCVRAAIDSTVAALNHPTLTTLNECELAAKY